MRKRAQDESSISGWFGWIWLQKLVGLLMAYYFRRLGGGWKFNFKFMQENDSVNLA